MTRFTSLLALLIVLPASAQDIPAKAAVGQCFSACATTLYASSDRAVIAVERNRELLWWDLLTTNEFQNLFCGISQNLAIEADICHAGCNDVKDGYGLGWRDLTRAESIFILELNETKKWLKQSGLYPDYLSRPKLGTPQFTAACKTFLRIDTDPLSSSVAKSLQQADKAGIEAEN